MRDYVNLNRLAYFTAVVDAGSFTAAAERLGITKAVVSQQVAKLEEEVGATLLLRTTRRVHPTEAGRIFHARCVNILKEAEDAYDEIGQSTTEPTGTLRITAPIDYGISVVVPAIGEFSRRHRGCQVALTLSDQTMDIAAGDLDMAIRVGWLVDSGLQARRLQGFRQLLVAAPGFADQVRRLVRPEDIRELPFVANAALREPLEWRFSSVEETVPIRVQAAVTIDATLAVRVAVLKGLGLSILPDFLVRDDLEVGRLLHVLPGWRLPDGGVHAVFPAARYRPRKVTAFVEMLIQAARAA